MKRIVHLVLDWYRKPKIFKLAKELGKDEALKKLDGLSADDILEKLAEIEAQEKAKKANRNK